MLMRSGLRDVAYGSSSNFDIIDSFSKLSPKRKILLCDHLFTEGRQSFYNTTEILWPKTTIQDAKRLETFLYSIKNR